MTIRHVRASWLPAVGMSGILAAYVAFHTPLRDAVTGLLLGRSSHSAYMSAATMTSLGAFAVAAVAWTALAAALLAAAFVADRFAGRTFEWPLAFGVGAFGFVAVPAPVIGGIAAMTGIPLLRPPLGPLLVSVPALFVVSRAVASGWRPALPARHRIRGFTTAVGALAGLMLIASAAISLSQPPTSFDALAYHGPLSVYLWRDGDIVAFLNRTMPAFALAMPGAAELWFGLVRIAGGERLADLGQLPFALLGAAAVQALARRAGAPIQFAAVSGLAYLLAPIVVLQAGVQLNDVVAAAMVLSAAALASASRAEMSANRSGLIGLALGLAAATKLAVVPAVAAILAVCAVWLIRRREMRRMPVVLALAIAFAIPVAPWWARNTLRFGNPVYPVPIPVLGAGIRFESGERKDDHFVPARAAWPLYPLIEPISEQSGFGALFLVAAVPGVLVATRRRRRPPFVLFAATALCALPAWWLMTMHDPRLLLVLAGFAFACIPGALVVVYRQHPLVVRGLVAVAALFTAFVTLDQSVLPRTRQQLARAEFYDALWNIDPAVASAPESEPLLYNAGYAPLSYAGDYALLGPSLGRRLYTIDVDASTDRIVQMMRDARVRYAYVPASAASQAEVAAKYRADLFSLVHSSTVSAGELAGTVRLLYELREPAPARAADESNQAGDDRPAAHDLVQTAVRP